MICFVYVVTAPLNHESIGKNINDEALHRPVQLEDKFSHSIQRLEKI